ncbi:MAG: hypothetical protein HYR51_03225 [Candidatus Rokubacteria bacterium]|nr:hypothetical protein [Candidatus Rokubacteria bacterium]
MTHEPVVLAEIPVMYVESATGLAGAADAFDRLEARFASLRGRKFYGTFLPPDGPYRACVAIEPGDDAAALGLPTWTIPGGKYRRGKVLNWSANMAEIGKTFARLAENAQRDASRPGVEFYRSEKELVLFLPVT